MLEASRVARRAGDRVAAGQDGSGRRFRGLAGAAFGLGARRIGWADGAALAAGVLLLAQCAGDGGEPGGRARCRTDHFRGLSGAAFGLRGRRVAWTAGGRCAGGWCPVARPVRGGRRRAGGRTRFRTDHFRGCRRRGRLGSGRDGARRSGVLLGRRIRVLRGRRIRGVPGRRIRVLRGRRIRGLRGRRIRALPGRPAPTIRRPRRRPRPRRAPGRSRRRRFRGRRRLPWGPCRN